MGIDYCAGYADVIEWEVIAKLVPQAAAEFMATIHKHQGDEGGDYLLAGLVHAINYEEIAELTDRLIANEALAREVAAEIMRSFDQLRAAFAAATAIPEAESKLELGLGYHNSADAGCRGDDVDGVYWFIADGAWVLSSAGKAFQNKFERKFFTSWG